jgi:hypothetical protein
MATWEIGDSLREEENCEMNLRVIGCGVSELAENWIFVLMQMGYDALF